MSELSRPALTCTRATALTGAAAGFLPGGLILKARTVLQQHRRSGSARVRAQRSKCVGVKRCGLMQGSNGCREWGIFTKHRAIDRLSGQRYSRGQSNEAFKFPIRLRLSERISFARSSQRVDGHWRLPGILFGCIIAADRETRSERLKDGTGQRPSMLFASFQRAGGNISHYADVYAVGSGKLARLTAPQTNQVVH